MSASFKKAMCEVQTELLKERIKKAWGPVLEQSADAFIEAAAACWQQKIAKIQAHEAKQSFQQKLKDLWLSASKKK